MLTLNQQSVLMSPQTNHKQGLYLKMIRLSFLLVAALLATTVAKPSSAQNGLTDHTQDTVDVTCPNPNGCFFGGWIATYPDGSSAQVDRTRMAHSQHKSRVQGDWR